VGTSYKQWQELGAQVKKAEKSSLIVFYKEYDVEPDTEVQALRRRHRAPELAFLRDRVVVCGRNNRRVDYQ